jgi:hypothetical protein
MNQNNRRELCLLSIGKLNNWIQLNGYAGWDPYDVKGMVWYTKAHYSNSKIIQLFRRFIDLTTMVFPALSRNILKIEKQVNPKAMGLLLSSYANLYEIKGEDKYLTYSFEIAKWLEQNANTDYKGVSWGYPFNWNSIIYIPKDTPSAIASVTVGDGFFKLYKITGEKKYLRICNDICVFLLKELNLYKESDDSICFSYTPIDNFQVNNINLLVAQFLVKIGLELDIREYIEYGEKAAKFSINQQNQDGSIFYWSKSQDNNNPKHLDLYHSGFEIRALFGLYKLTGKEIYEKAYSRYLEFFINNYFDSESIKIQPNKKNPIDIHACAEAIYCLSTVANENPQVNKKLDDVLIYTIENFQTKSGWFIYRKYSDRFEVKFPYLRWGQAWMMKALSEYLKLTSKTMT